MKAGLQKGDAVVKPQDLGVGGSPPRTLLIALNTRCQFCAGGIPFYNRLEAAGREAGGATPVLALFPNKEDEVQEYARKYNLHAAARATVDFSALNVAATPTAILVDSSGRVLDFWVGKLPAEVESKLLEIVGQSGVQAGAR